MLPICHSERSEESPAVLCCLYYVVISSERVKRARGEIPLVVDEVWNKNKGDFSMHSLRSFGRNDKLEATVWDFALRARAALGLQIEAAGGAK